MFLLMRCRTAAMTTGLSSGRNSSLMPGSAYSFVSKQVSFLVWQELVFYLLIGRIRGVLLADGGKQAHALLLQPVGGLYGLITNGGYCTYEHGKL